MKKFLNFVCGITTFTGAVTLLGLAGYMEVNTVDFSAVIIRAGIGIALLLLGYTGLKLGGSEYVD